MSRRRQTSLILHTATAKIRNTWQPQTSGMRCVIAHFRIPNRATSTDMTRETRQQKMSTAIKPKNYPNDGAK